MKRFSHFFSWRSGFSFLVSLWVGLGLSWAEGPATPWAVTNIAPELMKDADVVVRLDETSIQVRNASRSEQISRYVVTILNAKGKRYATHVVGYDRTFSKPPNIEGTLYNNRGIRVRKLKAKEVEDYSAVSGGSLYEDDRIRVANLEHNEYPYTVEFTHSQVLKDAIIPGGWYAQNRSRQAVEKATLDVSMPAGLELHYKLVEHEVAPRISDDNGRKQYQWTFSNLLPRESELMGPPLGDLLPKILLSPSLVVREAYEGTFDSWENYGKFFYEINKGRDVLPKELASKVQELCADLSDPREKIAVIYRYMQEHTRYVSVQIGLGGWQTYDAEYVYENGYGDCKALSNYMLSMLKSVGMPAYTALVYAGSEGRMFHDDFPSSQFNHAILCVPMAQDTVWLECTSSDNPPGYLGDFTEDRYVVLLTPAGGKLVRTPSSTAEDNLQSRRVKVQLTPTGDATVSVQSRHTGHLQGIVSQVAHRLTPKEQEAWLRKQLEAGSYNLLSLELSEIPNQDVPAWEMAYELDGKNWAGTTGSRMFLKPNVLGQEVPSFQINKARTQRTQPVELSSPVLYVDTVIYELPAGYHVESQGAFPVRLSDEFGSYEADFQQVDDQHLRYTRRLQWEKMTLPPAYAKQFEEFLRSVKKADQQQVVLKSGT